MAVESPSELAVPMGRRRAPRVHKQLPHLLPAAASVVLARARGCGYEFVPEAALLVLAAGLRVREVPITFTGRTHGCSKLGKRQAVTAIVSVVSTSFQFRLRLGRFARHVA